MQLKNQMIMDTQNYFNNRITEIIPKIIPIILFVVSFSLNINNPPNTTNNICDICNKV